MQLVSSRPLAWNPFIPVTSLLQMCNVCKETDLQKLAPTPKAGATRPREYPVLAFLLHRHRLGRVGHGRHRQSVVVVAVLTPWSLVAVDPASGPYVVTR